MTKALKTIEYRRADWFAPGGPLETRLRDAWAVLDTTLKRSISMGDATCMGIAMKDLGHDGVALHCAFFVDKQGVGTIPMRDQVAVALGEKAPDKGENFLITGVFAVISGDDVVTINANLNAARLKDFLYQLFKKAKLHEDSTKFDILRRPDIDKLKMIEERGVEEIDLSTSISEATLDRIKELQAKKGWISNAKAAVLNSFLSIIQKDDDPSTLLKAQKGKITLSIRVPNGDLQQAKHGLKELADEIVEDEDGDGFLIRLHGGEVIKSGEIAARRRVRITKHANYLDPDDAWHHLQKYVIEQKKNKLDET